MTPLFVSCFIRVNPRKQRSKTEFNRGWRGCARIRQKAFGDLFFW
jgi:hypothetical protein